MISKTKYTQSLHTDESYRDFVSTSFFDVSSFEIIMDFHRDAWENEEKLYQYNTGDEDKSSVKDTTITANNKAKSKTNCKYECNVRDIPKKTVTISEDEVRLRKHEQSNESCDSDVEKSNFMRTFKRRLSLPAPNKLFRHSFRRDRSGSAYYRCPWLLHVIHGNLWIPGHRPADLPLISTFELEPIKNGFNSDDVTVGPPIPKQQSVACMTDPAMICFVQGFDSRAGANGDNGKLQTVRNKLLRKSRSSGNFGSAGPRSAPSTPQGQLGAPQGLTEPLAGPTIQRSPSHSVFTKTDKTNLKHLSTSTPTMTAQGQLAEPPSPKAVKDPKVHTTSKARQKKFLRHFPNVEEDEKVLNHYSCALIGDILLQGHLYITKNYFAFYSNVFGYVTKLLIPILTVEEITKEKTARIIPNAVGITTTEDKHIFGSLMSRDSTLAYMRTVWEKAKSEEALPEPEITEPDQDSSESGESGRESPPLESVPSGTDVLASAKFDRIKKETIRNQTEGSLLERKGSRGFVRTLKDAITEFRKLPRQSLILVATTLLLILLFLSAAVLLYRINKIQNKYSISLQGVTPPSASNDIYSDLLDWQSHLHSKAAESVNNILDTNLDQVAKVRQSLEALSALLVQSQNPTLDNNAIPLKTENPDTTTESAPTNAESTDS